MVVGPQPGEHGTEAYYHQMARRAGDDPVHAGASTGDEISGMQEFWRQAYANTPHGLPVARRMPAWVVALARRIMTIQTITATIMLSPRFVNRSLSARPRFRCEKSPDPRQRGRKCRCRPPRSAWIVLVRHAVPEVGAGSGALP
jgi:hypothetical protein